jgi:hypothetical protein
MADEEAPQQAAGPDGEEVVIEVEKPKHAPRASDEELAQKTELPDDEISRYADDAQKRIKGLRVAYQEQKRRAEQWSRDASTASNLAEQLYRENQQLKTNVVRSENALIDQALGRAQSELEQAKFKHRQALTSQDPDLIVAAAEDMARAVAEADRLKLLKPGPQATQPAPAPGPMPQQPEPPSPRTEAWIAQQPWWQRDEEMTLYALKEHGHLALEGITDKTNPDLYWRTIEDKLQEKFPTKFTARTTTRTARPPVAVTGTQRTNGGTNPPAGKQVIRLTDSQVRMAGRIGVTLEQYAKQLIDEAKEREEGKRRSYQ